MFNRPIMLTLLIMTSCICKANLSFPASEIKAFSLEVAKTHDLDAKVIEKSLQTAKPVAKVLELMETPYEAKPWHMYQKIFITPEKIALGKKFLHDHKKYFDRAEKEYKIPREIIAAIIGVETHYGRVTGTFSVLDTLSTLAFLYPKRAPFFRKELGHFLKLSHDQKLQEDQVKGSYAGAIGLPQFMPSSYINFAVDFDGDGKTRLLTSEADAIGSVANYLKKHGWAHNQPVAIPAHSPLEDPESLWDDDIAPPKNTVKYLREKSLIFTNHLADDSKANLVQMKNHNNVDLWITLQNFYVISRYNHSKRYSMAVYLLSQKLL